MTPQFPVDDVTLDALEHALGASYIVDADGTHILNGADMNVSQFLDFMAGYDPAKERVTMRDEDGNPLATIYEGDPLYHEHDVIRSLITEVRRLRKEPMSMASTPAEEQHYTDDDGNPAGGFFKTRGIEIAWQNGPLAVNGERVEPNGAFVEDVIAAAIGRIEFYQASKFHSLANAAALGHLKAAAEVLAERTRDRQDRGVEGTHQK